MDFGELVTQARSFRRFDETRPIPAETMRVLVGMACRIPCGGNAQPLHYKIISTPTNREDVFSSISWAGALKEWDGPAPGERPTGYILILSESPAGIDTGIAAQTIQLGATALGFGACMLGAIKRDAICHACSIPAQYKLHLMVALGAPAETICLEPMPTNGSTTYWRTDDNVHHVPKRNLDKVLLP